ncbi:MAG: DUF3108 domain-containing protein, partial [Nitrosomonadales bacterium]|nr:DUF3108 domain-containing protein [Nitrosomonadales bacterium]
MLNRWFSFHQFSASWRVAIALALSLLLHLILLGFVHVDLSIFEPKQDVVEVRFASLVRNLPPAPLPKAAQEASEVQQKIEEHTPNPVTAEAATIDELTPPPSSDVLPQDQTAPVVVPSEEVTLSQEEPAPELDRVASEIVEDTPSPLSFVETEFDIFRGIDGSRIGQTRVHYQTKDDGSYVIESESEAKGLVSLFISGKLIQRSEGSVTETGLRPTTFLYQYGGANKAQRASFNWDNERITLETSKGREVLPLPGDAQDLISFMYQFMFVPPLQEMQLNITNGKRLKA